MATVHKQYWLNIHIVSYPKMLYFLFVPRLKVY